MSRSRATIGEPSSPVDGMAGRSIAATGDRRSNVAKAGAAEPRQRPAGSDWHRGRATPGAAQLLTAIRDRGGARLTLASLGRLELHAAIERLSGLGASLIAFAPPTSRAFACRAIGLLASPAPVATSP